MIKRIIKAFLFWIGGTIIPYYIGFILSENRNHSLLWVFPYWLAGTISLIVIIIFLFSIFSLIEMTYNYIKKGKI